MSSSNDDEVPKLLKLLDSLYGIAINGAPKLGIASAQQLADSYARGNRPLDKKINSLIRNQNAKSFTSGFLTGLGGIITLPITVPADMAMVLFVQLRMIAAIAIMRGFDSTDDRVKTLCYVSMVGKGAQEIVRDVGIQIGKKLLEVQIRNISGAVLTKINRRVGFRLVTKFGEKGAVNLGKMIPLVGGLVGGTADLLSTHVVGKTAKQLFVA